MKIKSSVHPLRYILVVAALTMPLAVLAQPGHDSRNGHQDQHHEQNNARGHEQQRSQQQNHAAARNESQRGRSTSSRQPIANRGNGRSYAFGQQGRRDLQTNYKRILGHVDRSRRPHFAAGQRLPSRYRGAITRAPSYLRRRLPPPPVGYEIGYYQGYTIVYNPTTLAILTVVDLLNQ